MFQSIQDELKLIIRDHLEKNNKDKTVNDADVENLLRHFFQLGDNKNAEIKNISDGCKNVKECAKKIFNDYIKYVRVNYYNKDVVNDAEPTMNESKTNGKYGFFMFLEMIDDMKNSFINENYLNTSDFNLFFTTDNIKDKNKLSDKLEYKRSLDVGYQTLIHIRNLRLSFYFGVRDYILEYGFHDDLKRIVYKIGEFKINSTFLNSVESFKCISLIRNILKQTNLKNLSTLKRAKDDLKYLITDNSGVIQILDQRRVDCTVQKSEINIKNYSEYFDSWCLKHPWYYTTYNYVDEEQDIVHFLVKIKDADTDLNLIKKRTDIKQLLKEDKESSNPVVRDKMTVEPQKASKLNSRRMKDMAKNNPYLNKNKKKDQKSEADKNRINYFKDLKKAVIKIDKDQNKDNGYLTKYMYPIVQKFNKPLSDVKNDILWMNGKLRENPNFVEDQIERLKN